ncbi:MAG: hypothetical protein K5660_09110 [Paludibacteraceae bacterium]|nr:hypothetical protein [Paludibacteraceae bacterium]
MKRAVLILLLTMCLSVRADRGMHTWQSHIAYGVVTEIADTGDDIYALAGSGLIRVDKATGQMTCYSKQDGFHGAGIAHIGYDIQSRSLIVLYEDGLIDFVKDGRISALSDLQMKQMSASKKANSLTIHDGKAYLAMPFGVVAVNIRKQEILDTYYIGDEGTEVDVRAVCCSEDSAYALASDRVYAADKNANLLDFNVWNSSRPIPAESYNDIAVFNNRLYILADSVLHLRVQAGWQPIAPEMKFLHIKPTAQHLYLLHGGSALIEYIEGSGLNTIASPYYILDVQNDNGTLWYAAGYFGVVRHDSEGTQTFIPEGPAVNIPYRMKVVNNRLYVVPGARWSVQEFRAGYVMIYDIAADTWTNIETETVKSQTGTWVLDFMNVAVDPFDKEHFIVTSYGTGMYEFLNNQLVRWYNHLNSPLQTLAVTADPFLYIRTDAAMFDSEGNLWVLNMGINEPLHVISPQQLLTGREQGATTWNKYGFVTNDGITFPLVTGGEMFIDRRHSNWKWIPYVRYTPGLILYDDNHTPFYQGDDNTYFTTSFVDQDGKTISPSAIYAVVQDLNNDLWVTVDEGFFIIPAKVDFRSSNSCTRVKIPRNDGTNLADYLLGTERINAIAVDGANRKWMGTESSGLYLVSEDGQETLEHFTTDNSPLPSNQILSVAIDPQSGKVFVGTGAGLVSYQGDATEAEERFTDENLYAYPNPVRPGYEGVITIAGLMEETVVKIVDNGGNLVCQTRSNGGLAVWDGKNGNGQRVASGVYTAFCNTADGANHAVVKILIIH